MILLSSLVADAATAASGTPQWVLVGVQNPSGGFSSYSFGSTDCITASSCFSANTGITSTSCGARIRRALERQGVVDHEASVVRPGGRRSHHALCRQRTVGSWGRGFVGGYPTHAIILHWNGKVWKLSPSPPVKTASALNGIACYASGCVSVGVECVKGTSCFSVGGATRDVRRASARRDMGRTFMVDLGIGPAQRQRQCQPRRGAVHECHPLRHARHRGERFPASLRSPTARCGTEKCGRSSPCPSRPRRIIIRTPRLLNDLACTSASDCVAVGGATPQSSRSLASLAAHREVERLDVDDRQAEARPFRATSTLQDVVVPLADPAVRSWASATAT